MSCGPTAPVKDEPANKTSSNKGIKIPLSQSQFTEEGENGEANGNHEAIDMHVGKVEASAIAGTKEVTAESLNRNAEAENKITAGKSLDEAIKEPLMVKDAIDCNKGPDSVTKEGAEKASEEDTSKIKEVEPPQSEGIHALIEAVPKPQEEEVLMIPSLA